MSEVVYVKGNNTINNNKKALIDRVEYEVIGNTVYCIRATQAENATMIKKEDTPIRISRRTYEEKHKEERKKLNKVWGTSIPRKDAEKIDAFLSSKGLSKVDLIMAGFAALVEQFEGKKTND